MKTLLLHYWLVNHRGGEKVLDAFHGMFPDADMLTHVHDRKAMALRFPSDNIRCTFINSLPLATKLYRAYLPLMPLALQRTDISGYDFLLSSESGPIKGVRKRADTLHVCYCHTPMRYLWDMYQEYYDSADIYGKLGMRLFRSYLRNYDLKSAENVDYFIANSRFVAERIKRIYDRTAEVIHPPVDVDFFMDKPREPRDYYLYAGELCHYKRPDIAVDAFIRNGRKLIVAGCGSELKRLMRRAGGCGNIIFEQRVDNFRLRELYRGCRALVFPGIEDFGIMPVEAQAAGAPVIAFGDGGTLETVKNSESGLFFHRQNSETLVEAVEEFESLKFDPLLIRRHAATFSEKRFIREMRDFLNQLFPNPGGPSELGVNTSKSENAE